jgi:signal transduction histidine kinase
VISVSDEGPGIPAAERERVFERFHSSDPARSAGNAGLGLAICRWIVEMHGGTIKATPAHPHGCRMVVALPVGGAA